METINHECYVSFEVAKLLKKAGFDWECNHYYFTQNGKTESKFDFWSPARNYNETMATMDSKSFEFEVCSRPTLEVAQRWLREVHHFHITTTPDNVEFETWGWTIFTSNYVKYNTYCQGYSTYEKAQEAGLNKALEIILEKGE